MANVRVVSYYLIKVLIELTISYESISPRLIMEKLSARGVNVSRKTIYNHLENLKTLNIIDENNRMITNEGFSEIEMRYMIDAVMYSKQIPRRESDEIVEKLKLRISDEKRDRYKYTHASSAVNHTINPYYSESMLKLTEAIYQNRKVKIDFAYINRFGDLVYDYTTTMSPYFITVSNGNYYIIGALDDKEYLANKRIDRIINLEILRSKRIPDTKYINKGHRLVLSDFLKNRIYMFGGHPVRIQFKIKEENIKYITEYVGYDFKYIREEDEMVVIEVFANERDFHRLAIQFGDMIEVTYPKTLRDELVDFSKKLRKKYDK